MKIWEGKMYQNKLMIFGSDWSKKTGLRSKLFIFLCRISSCQNQNT